MLYYSTSKQSPTVNFRDATIAGLAPDKGLYFPSEVPKYEPAFIKNIRKYSNEEIAFTVIRPFVGDCIPGNLLRDIVSETVNFPFPLHTIKENIYSLELFHGPTLAFKDVGARFMSRCLSFFNREKKEKVLVLVATSGDTGGAVANGFFNVPGIDVVILYPSGKVSDFQEMQLTTLGGNVTACKVDGTFDDCQALVKQAFADDGLKSHVSLSSANSINVARWLPQQFYYLFAYQQWQHEDVPPVFSVPSGNFGNLCAGLLAYACGLPVDHFIAACNANDAVYDYIQSGIFGAKPTIATISNAMDVGNPSNFARLLALFNEDHVSVRKVLSAYSISDEETKATLLRVFRDRNYLLDPHGAVAFRSLELFLEEHPAKKGILLETAHPVKFQNVVQPLINEAVEIPAGHNSPVTSGKLTQKLSSRYSDFKEFLLQPGFGK